MGTDKSGNKKKTFVVLSLDGGGVKSLAQLAVAEKLSKAIGKPIAEWIDFATMTSGGAIAGMSLIASDPKDKNKTLFTPTTAKEMFRNSAPKIFSNEKKQGKLSKAFNKVAPKGLKNICNGIKLMRKLKKQKGLYSSENMLNVYRGIFGDLNANQTVVPFLTSTMDYQTGTPMWFSNLQGLEMAPETSSDKKNRGSEFYYVPKMRIRDVLLACTRPPVLFNLLTTKLKYRKRDKNGKWVDKEKFITGTDGAFFVASPDDLAYDSAKHWLSLQGMSPSEYRIVLVSLGTGRHDINHTPEELGSLGTLKQINLAKDMMLAAPYRSRRGPLKRTMNDEGDIYIRFEAPLNENDPNCPDSSLSNINEDNFKKLEKFADEKLTSGINQEDYDFTVKIIKKIIEGKDIENIVEERLGKKYKPLDKREFAKTGFLSRLFSKTGTEKKPANTDDWHHWKKRNNGPK